MLIYFIVVLFKLYLLVFILFRIVYIIKLGELIVGNIINCYFREIKSIELLNRIF